MVQNSVKNRVLHTGLVLNSLSMPVAFFDLFDTDDHIDRVEKKELRQVCFIYFLL